MKCTHCQAPLDPHDKFCGNCGTPVPATSRSAPPSSNPRTKTLVEKEAAEPAEQTPRSSIKKLIVLGLLFVVVISIILTVEQMEPNERATATYQESGSLALTNHSKPEEWKTHSLDYTDVGIKLTMSIPTDWTYVGQVNDDGYPIYKPQNVTGYEVHVKIITRHTENTSLPKLEEIAGYYETTDHFIQELTPPEYVMLDGHKALKLAVQLSEGAFPEMTNGEWKIFGHELVIDNTRFFINAGCKVGVCDDEVWQRLINISNKAEFSKTKAN